MDPRDNAALALKARVVHDRFDWQGDRPPRTPLADSVLYEVHVRGFTQAAPRRARGAARHLRRPGHATRPSPTCKRLGVTAVSLLPVHHLDEQRLVRHGPAQLLGLQHARLLLPRPALCQPARRRSRARRVPRTWCARCTPPASR